MCRESQSGLPVYLHCHSVGWLEGLGSMLLKPAMESVNTNRFSTSVRGQEMERLKGNQGGNLSACTLLTNNESFMEKQLYTQGKKSFSLKWQKWKNYWLVLTPNNRTTSLQPAFRVGLRPSWWATRSLPETTPQGCAHTGSLLRWASQYHESSWIPSCFGWRILGFSLQEEKFIEGNCSLAPLNFF